jgi:hypothetical protein
MCVKVDYIAYNIIREFLLIVTSDQSVTDSPELEEYHAGDPNHSHYSFKLKDLDKAWDLPSS